MGADDVAQHTPDTPETPMTVTVNRDLQLAARMADEFLTRSFPFQLEGDSDGLTIEGYAAVFNTPARIDSWEGKFDEVVAPGAFKRTLDRKGPKGIKLQFDHGTHPLLGSLPLGTWEVMREDARGLYVRGRLSDNWLIQPFRDAIREGAVDGMSFRFRAVQDDWDNTPNPPTRTLREIELREAGPVVWPAYIDTAVGVRARQVAHDLAIDDDFRDQLVKALATVGTGLSPDPSGPDGTPAATDDPTGPGPRRTPSERQQAYRRLFGNPFEEGPR